MRLGLYKKAIEYYDKAIELNPNYYEAYNNRGKTMKYSGKLQNALEDYTKAIELNSSYSEAYNNRGLIKLQLDIKDEALDDFYKAIEINPNSAETYNNLGMYYKISNDLENALKNYNKSIELNPNISKSYFGRAVLKIELLNNINNKQLNKYKKSFEYAYNDLDIAYNLADEQFKETIKNHIIGMARERDKVAKKFCKDKGWDIK